MAAKVTKARDEGRRLSSAWGGVDDREIKVWGESFQAGRTRKVEQPVVTTVVPPQLVYPDRLWVD